MKYRFNYPEELVLFPEYSAHRGQEVIIVRPLIEGIEYDEVDPEHPDPMVLVQATDGWVGAVWMSELEPIPEN